MSKLFLSVCVEYTPRYEYVTMCTVLIQFILLVTVGTVRVYILISPNEFFLRIFLSHLGGSNEQFGTHEKLSWGAR